MTVSIMQPTFLPWTGYFNLMANSDIFVFLDDVQFEKQSWQQRNRIIQNKNECMLSLPVLTKGKHDQLIADVILDDKHNWREKQLKTIQNAYSKHLFGNLILDIFEKYITKGSSKLCELNTAFIIKIKEMLNLKTNIIFSSNLKAEGKRSNKIYNICKMLGATQYLSPVGSKEYIEEDKVFDHNNLPVIYQNYIPVPYPQKDIQNFIPYMSIVDLLANVGPDNAIKYILPENNNV